MPRKGWIDKSTSTTYALVHRPQNDPKIHDASSSAMVFQELAPSQAHKIKNRSDLESELFGSHDAVSEVPELRENEGEAAEYGIYYDDTEYDYMQHMRDLNGGNGSGKSYFVEAPAKKEKGKGKVKLEDALRGVSLDDGKSKMGGSENGKQLLDDDILPSRTLKKTTYQDQQDVPDALTGFQPDMDPRLREVLEALEDEAYVDDEEDLFGELAKDREEISLAEFEELDYMDDRAQDDEDGWESDHTAKPIQEYRDAAPKAATIPSSSVIPTDTGPDHGDGEWMAEFSKFKKATKTQKTGKAVNASNADLQSSILTASSLASGRHKKRKGALTSSTGYSMTSSSLFRTEGLTLLDARFDNIEEEYADQDMLSDDDDDDDGAGSVMTGQISNLSGVSRASNLSSASKWSTSSSQAPNLVMRKDFDGIMDEFLGGYSMSGKRRVKKGAYKSGMEQLDEIRQELRVGPQKSRQGVRQAS
ncbi:hypothetical protein MMC26_002310 [Xylographa opegraphella]|nr:hypothetical protein [Xylographa opegraphella]